MIAIELVNVTELVLRLATVAAILLITYVVAKLFTTILRGALRVAPPLIVDQAVKIASAFVWVVGLLLAVNQLGLNLDVLLVLLAVAGVGLIVAARDVLSNFLSKLFIGIYIPVKVGDYISVDGLSGKVVEINPVATLILMDDGTIATVPNAQFVKGVSVNKTSVAPQRISIPVTIPSKISFPKAEAELLKLVYRYKPRLDQRFPPIFTVKSRGPNSVEGELDLFVSNPELREVLSAELFTKIRELLDRLEREAASK
jgi:small conductance mechanosensitive channel